ILLINLGPMILLGVSVWLLYLIFKQFMKADSLITKVIWVVIGLILLSISLANMYALIAVAAAFALYWIYKKWNEKKPVVTVVEKSDDPFINFENEWNELSNKNF